MSDVGCATTTAGVHRLPVHSWLGGHGADTVFDAAVVALCDGPTIDLGCGPGRLVAHLVQRGIPALGVDQSATAVRLARRSGAPALLRDVFEPLPGTGRWQTVLLADGNVGLAGDPRRILRRASELLRAGGRCVAEFDPEHGRGADQLGAVGVVADHRALVQVGLGGCRLRGRTGRRGWSGVGRVSPDRPARRGYTRADVTPQMGNTTKATLRGTAVTARVGVALGIAVTVCFATGLISHFIQHPQPWFFWPTRPVWLYQLTQGLHVISGIAAIPLLLVKLWSVYPKLFERPIIGGLTRQLERASILVLVGAMIFQLSTGIMNIAQWYAFKFFFTTSHYAMAYVAAGAVIVHIGVKLPVIRRALGEPLEEIPTGELRDGSQSARGAGRHLAGGRCSDDSDCRADDSMAASGLAAGAAIRPRTAGCSGEPVGVRRGRAGQRALHPITGSPSSTASTTKAFTVDELAAMPQTTHRLPIACVEGWSATADWTGVVLADLLKAVGAASRIPMSG